MDLWRLLLLFAGITLYGLLSTDAAVKDTREGENVSLDCHFAPQPSSQNRTYYWSRKNKWNQDNVAIQDSPLDPNYRLDFRPEEGRYDLSIRNVSYARDDATFECRVKLVGSGKDLHAQTVALTVLTPPRPPVTSAGSNPTATEGKPFELNCSSHGGSPTPTISWYREDSAYQLQAEVRTEDSVTTSVLSLKPTMKDDGIMFRCVVWNRAMPDGNKLETKVKLNVNYFPRVQVGPENPLRVERDGTADLHCSVVSKPRVTNVRWTRNDRFVSTSLSHTLHRVTVADAGKYTCSADNGLGQKGEAEMIVDVLYPPSVSIQLGTGAASSREAEAGETLVVKCNVSANPEPITVEWIRPAYPEFRQSGSILKIASVNADHAGTYMCRAINVMKNHVEHVGNATITLLVRHKPGRARIAPDAPVASEGTPVTLTCSANPPGWPVPTYRWWREASDSGTSNTQLAAGAKYTIANAQLSSEGRYYCQASNEMGPGTPAQVLLQVYQPPRFSSKLAPHMTRRIGDADFSVSCAAQGKPKPAVKWLKDGSELTADWLHSVEITLEESEGRNAVYTVQSVLRFRGERPGGNQLTAADRGDYACVFENQVKRAESSMHLRIEHEPIVLHQYNKVAYDLGESGQVVCRVQAYPRPEFQWSYGTNNAPLGASSEGHYEISTAADSGDVYTSVLKIEDIRAADYGDYVCRVGNGLGTINTVLHLQAKGPPDSPLQITAVNSGPNYVSLKWEPGFDGGLLNTKFFVYFRRVATNLESALTNGECGFEAASRRSSGEWQEFDCQRNNPCNVTSLEQHHSYAFKVKAFNTKGNSNFSTETTAMTRVDRIAAPQRVTFDPSSHQLVINSAASCLQLVAHVETSRDDSQQWSLIETLPMTPGQTAMHREATILSLRNPKDLPDKDISTLIHSQPKLRVKLCLRQEPERCSRPTEADIGPTLIKEANLMTTPTLIAIVVSCILFLLFAGLMYVFCRCKTKGKGKGKSKDYEVEQSVHPSLVTLPPPPYYPSAAGMTDMDGQMDRSMEDSAMNKPPLYGYHGNLPQQMHQNPNQAEWVNMGYMDNSYSNSNNGGSVNSQDSLWQMKMAAAGLPGASYGYDPMTHGGYGTAVDDYAPYPHHQEYAPDPYAGMHKAKKCFDQQRDSPGYRDVSGLPDPYMDPLECEENKPQQHISLSFDESLESGYSTPNSRHRRVIREIIV